MIIVQLKGGLGNQLFQYASGLSLSKYHEVPLKVDTSELYQPDDEIGTIRKYELHNFLAAPEIASNQEIEDLKHQNLFSRIFQKTKPSYSRKIYNEKRFEFDKKFFLAGNNLYLKGYRQSEKYFSLIANEIKNGFQLKKSIVEDVLDYGEKLFTLNSISIHIRRGDYINKKALDFHGLLTQEYYQKTIDRICIDIPNPIFFVFSDNIEWVKNNLTFKNSIEFVSGKITKNHYQDFYLMSQCRHNIIANSTFSWWAAWLNNHPNKIVIAPKNWFGNAPCDTKDLYPATWMKV